jgi:hypothetical protein
MLHMVESKSHNSIYQTQKSNADRSQPESELKYIKVPIGKRNMLYLLISPFSNYRKSIFLPCSG